MSEITIKKLLKTDYPFVRAVWEAAGLSIRPVCKGRDSEEAFSAQLEFEGSFYIGAFEGERLVGVLLANHEGRKGWLNRMAVHPDYRRRGIAAQMVKAAEELLKKEGIYIYGALVEDWNEVSLNVMQKLGYILHRDILYLSKRDSEDI